MQDNTRKGSKLSNNPTDMQSQDDEDEDSKSFGSHSSDETVNEDASDAA